MKALKKAVSLIWEIIIFVFTMTFVTLMTVGVLTAFFLGEMKIKLKSKVKSLFRKKSD